MKPIISIESINKYYDSRIILKNITLDVEKGSVVAIIGPSGSGKTTLLRCLNYLTKIDNGKISIKNLEINTLPPRFDIRSLRKKVGIVFQQYNLWPHKTVLENLIEAPMLVLGLGKKEAIQKAYILLNKIGLVDKKSEYPLSLSGGQQQRVAIARALIMDPEILLLDEITSSLDPETAWEVLELLKKVVYEKKRTIIIVTHQLSFVKEIADSFVFINNGEIIEQGTPQKIFTNPKYERTRLFLKHNLQYYK